MSQHVAVHFHEPHYPQPRALSGFENVNRYWDKRQGVYAAKILPGQFYVSRAGEMIVTVLGSCVSACVRDPMIGVGGMNHFMLPIQRDNMLNVTNSALGEATRYGNWAMEFLVNEILKQGGKRQNLEVKIFGGGKVLSNMNLMDVGQKNISFVHEFLHQEGMKIKAEDVGGVYPRKVLYFSDTGSVKMRKLKTVNNETVFERELSYAKTINSKPAQGDVELF